jgi:hypothetical protein
MAIRPATSPSGFAVASACAGETAGGGPTTVPPSSDVGVSGNVRPSGIVRNVEPYRSSSGRVRHAAIGAAGGPVGLASFRTRHAVPAHPRVAERA